jgi:4-hydroxy-tetrahydrodipicolinate reductase
VDSPIRIVVSGATGRMGTAVTELATADPSYEVIGGIDRDHSVAQPGGISDPMTIAGAPSLLQGADVVIDFSAPPFLTELLEHCSTALAGKGLVIGTTGLGPEVERLLEQTARHSAVLRAANFSVGVNLLLALAERAASVLGPEEFDIEIVETHHRRKEDAPSGTALALGEAVAAGRGIALEQVRQDGRTGRPGARARGEIGFHSLRGGDVIGDHQVHFISDMERIELAHRAGDRRIFAAGALRAAGWLVGREAGSYSMRDLLGF